MIERTFVALKPDAIKRKLMGKIIQRFEDKGFNIVEMKMILLDDIILEQYYGEHKGKDFYDNLVSFMKSGSILAMVIEGEDAIKNVRTMVGATKPWEAEMGTIRGDYGLSTPNNIIHASDSLESAKREINLFFKN
ncbi:nucleoside-diphosphate kinase [Methanococcus voltae]|uniref:Nucleoside diphosphate kinase n=1 Tax=Methanococcus voltae (strain ATCC BAA-1334 / A3) TaxID=456320 RepID=D7DV57_METV3|nr:nucleoside-diphosphate kinase [Methanococcus voltae]MCS3900822.1 nucleoside-diphosphate kinase [Methanococcus voltae]